MSEDATAILAAILERNEHLRSRYGYVGGLLALTGAKDDVPHLVAAVEAVLGLADEWAGTDAGLGLFADIRQEASGLLREAITAALSGTAPENVSSSTAATGEDGAP